MQLRHIELEVLSACPLPPDLAGIGPHTALEARLKAPHAVIRYIYKFGWCSGAPADPYRVRDWRFELDDGTQPGQGGNSRDADELPPRPG